MKNKTCPICGFIQPFYGEDKEKDRCPVCGYSDSKNLDCFLGLGIMPEDSVPTKFSRDRYTQKIIDQRLETIFESTLYKYLAEFDELKSKVQMQQERIEKQQDKIDRQQAAFGKQQATLTMHKEEIVKRKEEIEQQQIVIGQQKSEIELRKNEIQEQQDAIVKQQETIAEQQDAIAELKRRIDSIGQEMPEVIREREDSSAVSNGSIKIKVNKLNDPQEPYSNGSIKIKVNKLNDPQEPYVIEKTDWKKVQDSSFTEQNGENLHAAPVGPNSVKITDQIHTGDTLLMGSFTKVKGAQAEALEWRVLDVSDGKALLITKDGIDAKPFHETHDPVNWGKCNLKTWLNGYEGDQFLGDTFSDQEQRILRKDSSYCNRDASEQVFLLTVEEARKYFSDDKDRICSPTPYAVSQGAYLNTVVGSCWWWLKSPGQGMYTAALVSTDGTLLVKGFSVDRRLVCVRPAMWLDLDTLNRIAKLAGKIENVEPVETENNPPEPEKEVKQLNRGEIVYWGNYPKAKNGPMEPLQWEVLKVVGGKALLITKFGIDTRLYHDRRRSITWKDCSLREWLNGNGKNQFFSLVFTEEEKMYLSPVYTVNDENPEFGTKGGEVTLDKVFLLSISEAEHYFDSDSERKCLPTGHAFGRGVYLNTKEGGSCWWWLRSPGYNQDGAAVVSPSGAVNRYGQTVNKNSVYVRPAIWLAIEDLNREALITNPKS